MWLYTLILSLLSAIGGTTAITTAQQRVGSQIDTLSDTATSSNIVLTAVSDGAEGALSEIQRGEGVNLSSTITQQNIRLYSKSSSVPYCHNCFGKDLGPCRVCLHGEHESSVSHVTTTLGVIDPT